MWEIVGIGVPVIAILVFLGREMLYRRVSIGYAVLFCASELMLAYAAVRQPGQEGLTALLAVLVLLVSLGNSSYIRKKYEERFMEYQAQALSRQVEEVKEIYNTMRGWRHDYHNHMQKLKAHIAAGQWQEAGSYLDQLDEDLGQVKVKYQTGNVSLDAILNSKLSLAEKENVDVNCKVELYEELAISDIDLCVLIGNLIDNAVESCSLLTDNEKRFLRIYICVRRNQLYIAVTNATGEVIRRLDQEYITHKRGNHGHGLKRIDAIVEKYQGYIKRANEPGVFSTEIMLPLPVPSQIH